MRAQELCDACQQDFRCVLARHGQHVLAGELYVTIRAAQDRADLVLDVLGLGLLDDEHGFAVAREVHDLVGHERIDDVEHVDRHIRIAGRIREADLLQGAHQGIVDPALHDDADILMPAVECLVEFVLGNELPRGGHAHVVLALLLAVGDGRVRDLFVVVRRWCFEFVPRGDRGCDVVFRRKLSLHVAGADAQFQHDGGV